jgi:peroxiredoxin
MRHGLRSLTTAVSIGLLAAVGACNGGRESEANAAFRPIAVGDAAPSYTVASLDGDSIRLGGGPSDGLTVVNVWATWCESCREEFADLEQMQRDFASRGVRIVAVSVDQGSTTAVERFVREQKATFPVAHDREGRIQRLYAAVGVPSTYLIGRDGRIAWRHTGSLHADPAELRGAIERQLGGGADSGD